jgi:uncharacterized RDD family membrane protein YckC
MKCPKCHYLSFEPEPRCRNCGYDLATRDADPGPAPDPVIRNRDAEGPLGDFDLRRPSPPEVKPASTLGPLRPGREPEPARASASYRPPVVRKPETLEAKPPRPYSGVAVAETPDPYPPDSYPPRSVPFRPEASRVSQSRQEPVRPARPEFARHGGAGGNAPRVNAPRVNAPRVDAPRVDAPRVDAPRVDAPRVDAPRSHAPKVVAPPAQKRAPHTTTTDLPLFLKRLPDPEPPEIAAPIRETTAIETPIERRSSPRPEAPVTRPVPPIVKPTVESVKESAAESVKEPAIEKPIEAPVPLEHTLDRALERPAAHENAADLIAAEIDRPLIKVPSAPRPPLSVRRPADQPQAAKTEPEIAIRKDRADRDLLDDLDLFADDAAEPGGTQPAARRREQAVAAGTARPAGVIGRSIAAVLDASFLAALGWTLLWVTMRVCDLTMADLPALPLLAALPLILFLLMIDLGYLVLFTAAGGQTLGKMAAGIRVIGTSAATGRDERLDIPRAAFRSVVVLPSVLALGAGFLPALVGDRRAVHDRVAQTRVVRV